MVKHSNPGARHLPRGLSVLYEDRDILVVDKPAGLLTIATDAEKERTAYHHLTEYVRKGQARSRNRIFIVHRLDRETSGVLVFAKTEEAKFSLQEHWDETEKVYLAVVPGHLTRTEGVIESYLTENKAHVVYSTNNPEKGKWSRTAYRVVCETKEHSLLEVDLLTGRKHQIRVHLANIGHPVVGDGNTARPLVLTTPWRSTPTGCHSLIHSQENGFSSKRKSPHISTNGWETSNRRLDLKRTRRKQDKNDNDRGHSLGKAICRPALRLSANSADLS
jgi:RluA family pseudouridine synthase